MKLRKFAIIQVTAGREATESLKLGKDCVHQFMNKSVSLEEERVVETW